MRPGSLASQRRASAGAGDSAHGAGGRGSSSRWPWQARQHWDRSGHRISDFDGADGNYAVAVPLGTAAPAAAAQSDDPVANASPTVTGADAVEYAENGQGTVGTYTATDPNGQGLAWALFGEDAGLFSIDAGALTFRSPPDYEDPGDADGDNVYRVTVAATDASAQRGRMPVAVTVTDVRDPNIVLIVADDAGFELFAPYGSTQYSTPRLTEIADAGVRFTNAFSKPSCTPSRVALMTGKSNIQNYDRWGALPVGEYTFVNLLESGGYATAAAGKWQLHKPPLRRAARVEQRWTRCRFRHLLSVADIENEIRALLESLH